jgi:hypothetical protein
MDTVPNTVRHISKLTNLQRLQFTGQLSSGSKNEWMKLTTLANIEELEFNYSCYPLELVSALTNLKHWVVRDRSATLPDLVRVLKNLTNLESLYGTYNHVWPAIIPNPSRLTLLHMEIIPQYNFKAQELTDLNINTTPDDSFSILTSLNSLQITKAPFMPNLQSNTNLTCLTLRCRGGLGAYDTLSVLTKLKQFDFSWPENATASFLTAMTALESVTITLLAPENTDFDRVLKYLHASVTNLEVLYVPIDLGLIQHLTNLHQLSIQPQNNSFFSGLTTLTRLDLQIKTMETMHGLSAIDHLIKLKKLTIEVADDISILEEQFPSLKSLTELKIISLHCETVPPQVVNRIFAVESLESIRIAFEEDELIDHSLISRLTSLKHFCIRGARIISEQFWRNLTMETQLESLSLAYIGDDSCIESLVNLTQLYLNDAAESFTGASLTKLTSLKSLEYYAQHPFIMTKLELQEKLPNLDFNTHFN